MNFVVDRCVRLREHVKDTEVLRMNRMIGA